MDTFNFRKESRALNVFVTGSNGQLGSALCRQLKQKEIKFTGVNRDGFDITNPQSVLFAISNSSPDVVIHCAAWTAVDLAETHSNETFLVNELGTSNVALACEKIGIPLVYISTDYIFDGKKQGLYYPHEEPAPLSVYGASKAAGERIVCSLLQEFFIVRTSWMFGFNGRNFVDTILQLASKQSVINVVADQFGSPTYVEDLATLLIDMIYTHKFGFYHAHNEGFCSWAEFAKEIINQAKLSCYVNPVTSNEYPQEAERPKNCRLDQSSLYQQGFTLLPHWKDALTRYLKQRFVI